MIIKGITPSDMEKILDNITNRKEVVIGGKYVTTSLWLKKAKDYLATIDVKIEDISENDLIGVISYLKCEDNIAHNRCLVI